MLQFKQWLEDVERDEDYWQRFFLAVFRLDKRTGGLAQNVAGLDITALKGSSEFLELPPDRQQEILNRIAQKNGTVGDLSGIAAGGMSHPSSDALAFPSHDDDEL